MLLSSSLAVVPEGAASLGGLLAGVGPKWMGSQGCWVPEHLRCKPRLPALLLTPAHRWRLHLAYLHEEIMG